jgi:hypothetical protein
MTTCPELKLYRTHVHRERKYCLAQLHSLENTGSIALYIARSGLGSVFTLILSSGLIRVQTGVDQKELLLLQAGHRHQVPLVGAPRAIFRLLANKQL